MVVRTGSTRSGTTVIAALLIGTVYHAFRLASPVFIAITLLVARSARSATAIRSAVLILTIWLAIIYTLSILTGLVIVTHSATAAATIVATGAIGAFRLATLLFHSVSNYHYGHDCSGQ